MSILKVDTIQGKTTATTVAMPAGTMLQTVYGNLGNVATSSSTMSSMSSLNITPKFSSSVILITVQYHIYIANINANSWRGGLVQIKRGSTSIQTDGGKYGTGIVQDTNSVGRCMLYQTLQLVDSPNTTSATTYEVFGSSKDGAGHVDFNNTTTYSGGGGKITLQEIAQ